MGEIIAGGEAGSRGEEILRMGQNDRAGGNTPLPLLLEGRGGGWVTVRQAAEMEGVGGWAIHKRVDRGQLRSRKDARGRVWVRVGDLHTPLSPLDRGETLDAIAAFPERARREALERLAIIQEADRVLKSPLPPFAKGGMRKWFEARLLRSARNDKLPKGIQTYRGFLYYRKKYNEEGLVGLIDMRGRVPRDAMNEDVRQIIAGLWLQEHRPTYTQVREQVKLILENTPNCRDIGRMPSPLRRASEASASTNNGKSQIPSIGQIRRFIRREIPHAAQVKARHGREAYDAETPYIERDYTSVAPGEYYCSDHTQLDVAVRSPKNGKPLFPWITLIMDIRSRKIVGWWLDEKPSGHTIAASCRRAFIQYSLPKFIMFDNGRDYRSRYISGGQITSRSHRVQVNDDTRGLLTSLGIRVHFTTPYHGQSKPVERLFRRLKEELLKLLPGYRGGSVDERPDKLSAELKNPGRLLSLADMHNNIDGWVGFYNSSQHRGHGMDGRTPDEVFGAEDRRQNLVNRDSLTFLMMPAERRTVQRNGVQFMKGWYDHPILMNFRNHPVQLRYDPQEIGRVAIFDVKGSFVCWATHRRRLSFFETEKELSSSLKEQASRTESARETIRWAHEAVDAEGLRQTIVAERRRKAAQARAKLPPRTHTARRLQTDYDKAAMEMAVAKEMDGAGLKPCGTPEDTSPLQPRIVGAGSPRPKRVWGGPGVGYIDMDED